MSTELSSHHDDVNQHLPKRAIVVLLTNYSLQQFLWYFSTCPHEYEWDALILPYDLANSCSSVLYNNSVKCGIFNEVIVNDVNRNALGLLHKIKEFIPLLTSYITGRRVLQCGKIVSGAIGTANYDLYIVFSDFGILPGAIIASAKNRNVLVFEDGLADYSERSSRFVWKLFSLDELVGFILAKMGYCNPAYRYINKPTTQCIKYCSYPEWMKFKDYVEIHQLFNMSNCNEHLYMELLNKAFLSNIDPKSLECDVVLLGTVMSDYVDNVEEYYQKVSDYLYAHYSNLGLLVKSHPREAYCHDWSELNYIIADNSVSADLLIPLLRGKKFISMFPSTALFAILQNGCNCQIIHFSTLAQTCTIYEEDFNKSCEIIRWPKDRIIQL